jgi:kynurenine formamidase
MAGKLPGDLTELLADAPTNWGKWGPDDQVGGLNYLTPTEVLRAIGSVQTGRAFTLMLELGNPKGDPLWPGRVPYAHFMTQDRGTYESGKTPAIKGGIEYADDVILVACHGSTHVDALGHTWYDGRAWNGFRADGSKGGLESCSVLPLAQKGIVGHAVLLDVARYRGVPYLPMHSHVSLDDLLGAAKRQKVELQQHDILVLRTGILQAFYEKGPEEFYGDFDEPGLTYSRELLDFFHDMEIPVSATDILAGEMLTSATVDAVFPLHAALSRNLGVVFVEGHWLEAWAADCAADGKYDGLYMASPLKIRYGTASPVNPILIK